METENKIGKLILCRHTESEWNKKGIFTGKKDVHLSAEGFENAEAIGRLIQDIHINKIFTSAQVRSIETEVCMMNGVGEYCTGTIHSCALNERDYGIYTGTSKEDQKERVGEEGYLSLRRGWEYPVPGGETLKMVYERVVPFFKSEVLTFLNQGKNVLIVSHGNTLRALMKYIENISDTDIEKVEMLFNEILIYDLNSDGHILNKEARKMDHSIKNSQGNVIRSKTKIVATIGPASEKPEVLEQMIKAGTDMVRLNFSWGTLEEKKRHLDTIRKVSEENNVSTLTIVDLPGPRIQDKDGHTFDIEKENAVTEKDREYIEFAVKNNADYVAVSFAGSKEDIIDCRNEIKKHGGNQKIIAKIERQKALDNLVEIINESDAVMIARGDLANDIPLETVPFVQGDIIKKCKLVGKPVITATQMLFSMQDSPTPTRAEATDVINAIMQGTDAVMLSEETTIGKFPIQTVYTMEHLALEAEKHLVNPIFNSF